MYEIVYQPKAQKALQKMPRDYSQRFLAAFDAIAAGQGNNLNIKSMKNLGYFRLRIGGWRAIYKIDNGRLLIYVLKIGARGDVYK
jgi:mRNA interferase RelE/StbE